MAKSSLLVSLSSAIVGAIVGSYATDFYEEGEKGNPAEISSEKLHNLKEYKEEAEELDHAEASSAIVGGSNESTWKKKKRQEKR